MSAQFSATIPALPAGAIYSSLPDGQAWDAVPEAFALVWGWWRVVARAALERSEGVSLRIVRRDHVAVNADHEWYVEISTTYAPQWEGILITVSHTGEFCWCGEQSAPDLAPPTDADRKVPWVDV